MIKVDHITKQFKQLKAVDDVSLEIEKGEIVCLIGPSGSGKSTVLRCIHGLEKPEKGEVYIDGQLLDPSKPDYMTLRRRMGFVFQHFHLFPNMSVMDNLTLAQIQVMKKTKEEAEKTAAELLKRVGLLDKRDEYPSKLSGGQKQRVAIARALCINPEVMLFDEPTSALDPEMVVEVLDVMNPDGTMNALAGPELEGLDRFEARDKAAELTKNTQAELRLFARQSVDALKTEITDLVCGTVVTDAVKAATADAAFMQKAILTLVKDWAKHDQLTIEAKDAEALTAYFAANAKALLDKGVTITQANGTATDFTITSTEQGYKIAFGEEELVAYFKEFLRPKLVEMLF